MKKENFILQDFLYIFDAQTIFMKKLYTLLVVVLIGFVGKAQIVNIPDANFKAKLLAASATASIAYNSTGTKIKIDTNSDGNIQISEALLVYQLIVSSSNIVNLTGIESFTNLTKLDCSYNQLTSLDHEIHIRYHLMLMYYRSEQYRYS